MSENEGILLVHLKSGAGFAFSSPAMDILSGFNASISLLDIDNASDTYMVHLAEKFLDSLNKNLVIVQIDNEVAEMGNLLRLFANLARKKQGKPKMLLMGDHPDLVRFSSLLHYKKVSIEELKPNISAWLNEG